MGAGSRGGEGGGEWRGDPLWSPAVPRPRIRHQHQCLQEPISSRNAPGYWMNDSIAVRSLFALMVYHGFPCVVRTLLALVRLFCELFPRTPDSLGFCHSLL